MKKLNIRAVDRETEPRKGELIIKYDEALNIILATEAYSEYNSSIKEELPAIISHWLQSPQDPPILLDYGAAKSWVDILRLHCQLLGGHSPTSWPVKVTKNPKKILINFSGLSFPPAETKKPKFKFIDLFAGIGGFRVGLEALGGKCCFSSEWDRHSKETYYKNYGEIPFGDITKFTSDGMDFPPDSVPEHDILCAGFPCQPFSQAGLQLGFEDARGTLFFDILTIAKAKRPKVLFLENVKRLKGHDKGRTFAVILNSLKEIGYKVYAKVIRAYDQGVPQNRERIFIVAFSEPLAFEFPKDARHAKYEKFGDILEDQPEKRYTISDRMWDGHRRRLAEHRRKGNGFGFSLFNAESEYVNTISARYWKDGSEVLVEQMGGNPRVLTPRECARLQGYPDRFIPHESKRHAYQQFGNSVAVPVIIAIGKEIVRALKNKKKACELLPLEPVII